MRGQAFVVFETLDSAKVAVKEMAGKELFEKPMNVHYAKEQSDATVQRQGNEAELDSHKKQRLSRKETRQVELDRLKKEARNKGRQLPGDQGGPGAKRRKLGSEGTNALENLPPNKILFLQELPPGITAQPLEEVFDKFKGFMEVRVMASRRLGFVEFTTDGEAVVAKEATKDLTIEGHKVKITYAKK